MWKEKKVNIFYGVHEKSIDSFACCFVYIKLNEVCLFCQIHSNKYENEENIDEWIILFCDFFGIFVKFDKFSKKISVLDVKFCFIVCDVFPI